MRENLYIMGLDSKKSCVEREMCLDYLLNNFTIVAGDIDKAKDVSCVVLVKHRVL